MSCGEREKAAKTEHTPEPWRIGRFTGPGSYEKVRETCGAMDVVVDTDSGPYVLAGCNINFPDDAKANARRIVACVNACAGMTNEQIDNVCMISGSLLNRFGEQMAYLGQVEKQRDELMKAAEAIEINAEECLDFDECTAMLVPIDDYHKLMEAIASAKEKQNEN